MRYVLRSLGQPAVWPVTGDDWLTGAGLPQMKFAYGTGRRLVGGGGLVQCDSIHRTRGSGPGGDTGSTNTRT